MVIWRTYLSFVSIRLLAKITNIFTVFCVLLGLARLGGNAMIL